MTYGHYDMRPSGGSLAAINHMPHSPGRRSSTDYRTKSMQWAAKAAARDSGISMASMSLGASSPETSPRDSSFFAKNSARDSGISMCSPRDSCFFFKNNNSLRDSGTFSAVIPEEAAWTQTRLLQQQREEEEEEEEAQEDLLLIEEEDEEEDEEDKMFYQQQQQHSMRQRDSGILSRSTSLSSSSFAPCTVPPTPTTLVSTTHAAEQLADEATTALLTHDWSTGPASDETAHLDALLAQGGALNATVHLPVALAPPACATIAAEADETTPGRGGIVTISPLRVALHNYTQARTSLCQGHRDGGVVQKETFLHLVERGADFWTRLSRDTNHHDNNNNNNNNNNHQNKPIPAQEEEEEEEEVAPDCQPSSSPAQDNNNINMNNRSHRCGSSVFEDLIDFTAQHYAGGPSFSLPLVKAMVARNNPRRLSTDDLTGAFEKLAACGTLGSVDLPVGRYLLSLPGVTPQGHYVRLFRRLDEEYLRGDWRARGRRFAGRRFAEGCDEF